MRSEVEGLNDLNLLQLTKTGMKFAAVELSKGAGGCCVLCYVSINDVIILVMLECVNDALLI